jgi:putative ABC transport system permease protein
MSYFDVFRMAVGAILTNAVRSILTALGIVIGVASVIAMVHLGQAATLSVTQQIESMGSNLLIVQSGVRGRGPGGTRQSSPSLTGVDALAIRNEIGGVTVAPLVSSSATLVWSAKNYPAAVYGTTLDFFVIRNWQAKSGRIMDESEMSAGRSVCVIGTTIVTEVFGNKDPLGATLRLGRTSCQVVGVMNPKGATFGEDLDNTVVMPIKTVQQRILGNTDVRQIYVSADDAAILPRVRTELESLIRQRRGITGHKEDDFNIRDMAEMAAALKGTTATLTMLLGAIAAVSLLVGGIGIMNIMLVSVTERTREIGIRIAIGATVRDVLTQFLVEAITLSMLGGLLGVALGIVGTYFATKQMNLPFVLTPEVMLVGFGFSVLIGVVFGFVPARKAAHMNPVEALRHE